MATPGASQRTDLHDVLAGPLVDQVDSSGWMSQKLWRHTLLAADRVLELHQPPAAPTSSPLRARRRSAIDPPADATRPTPTQRPDRRDVGDGSTELVLGVMRPGQPAGA